jgi:hypothetical protein
VGSPAKVVKRFDFERKEWVRVLGDGQSYEIDVNHLKR